MKTFEKYSYPFNEQHPKMAIQAFKILQQMISNLRINLQSARSHRTS